MKLSYDHPLVITIGPQLSIASIKHGVTEISLSDGRIVRLSIHVEGVKPNADRMDVSYSVITEVMVDPGFILPVHEVVQ